MFDFNNKEMVVNKLNELNNKDIPKMSLEKLTKDCSYLKNDYDCASEDEKDECNKHLNLYCEREYNDGKDIFSDEKCSFYWGLSHGEMVTNDNGINRTYFHYLVLNNHKHKVEMLLQYHPSVYDINE
jgi:hypothetical protein